MARGQHFYRHAQSGYRSPHLRFVLITLTKRGISEGAIESIYHGGILSRAIYRKINGTWISEKISDLPSAAEKAEFKAWRRRNRMNNSRRKTA